ncbi:MAG: multiprotein bridging factor aMBF1 [archaeon]
MDCEICGRAGELVIAEVSGTKLKVCKACSKFGSVVGQVAQPRPVPADDGRIVHKSRLEARLDPGEIDAEDYLISGYGEMIRHEREKNGWSLKELGLKLNEKESVVKSMEHEAIRPNDETVRKIERLFRVSLRQQIKDVIGQKKPSDQPLTLGDIARLKKD